MPLAARHAAVGSTNPAKVEAVRRALGRLAPGCEVSAIAVVGEGIPAQPFGDDQTRRGAEARARAALAAVRAADLGFGLEGGALLDDGRTWLLSWVAAIARDGTIGYASGLRMLLPRAAGERLRHGEELP